jgi:hypothetical protein
LCLYLPLLILILLCLLTLFWLNFHCSFYFLINKRIQECVGL